MYRGTFFLFLICCVSILRGELVADDAEGYPLPWSSETEYSAGSLVIHEDQTYMAQQSVIGVTPSTDISYWVSLEDLIVQLEDPGAPPPGEEIDSFGTAGLSDPGDPEPIINLLSNLDLSDSVSEEWVADGLEIQAVAPTGYVFSRWESNQAAINGARTKAVTIDEDEITGSSVIAVAHFTLLEDSITGATLIDANVSGWKNSDWFGDFYDAENGWVYHLKHGWMYLAENDASSAWTWIDGLDWVWIGKDVYPHMYMEDQKDWLWQTEDEEGNPFYYDYKETAWMTHDVDERTWWKNPGKVPSKKIAYDGGLPSFVEEYDSFGAKKAEEFYVGGLRHGAANYFSPGGDQYSLTWDNGRKTEGWFIEEHDDGTYWAKEFDNGYETGDSKGWHANGRKSYEKNSYDESLWDETGSLTLSKKYGQVVEGTETVQIPYQTGDDVYLIAYDDLLSSSGSYYSNPYASSSLSLDRTWSAGELVKEEAWYPNGKQAFTASRRKGKFHGSSQGWHDNGRRSWDGTWVNGVITSSDTWYSNGRKQSSLTYQPSSERLLAEAWYENGSRLMEIKLRGFDQEEVVNLATNQDFGNFLSFDVDDLEDLISDISMGYYPEYQLEAFLEEVSYATRNLTSESPIQMWWENGQKLFQMEIRNGMPYRNFFFGYENGRTGISASFDSNGEPTRFEWREDTGELLFSYP